MVSTEDLDVESTDAGQVDESAAPESGDVQESSESAAEPAKAETAVDENRSMKETPLEKAARDTYRTMFKKGPEKDPKTGQFTKAPAPVEKKAQAAPAAALITPAPAQKPIDTARVPDSWTKDAKAAWAALPPVIQAEVNKREADFRNAFAQHKNKAAFADQVAEMVNPHFAQWQQKNLDPRLAIRDGYQGIATLHFGTNEQKVELLRKLVKDFGIDIPKPGQAPAQGQQPAQPQQPQEFRDPRVDMILNERQQMQQRQVQAQWADANTQIESFANDPTNEHFALVREDMSKLLQAGVATDLKDAYAKAVAMNPTASAAEQAKAQAKAAKETADKAAAARKAAGVKPAGKPATFTPPTSGKRGTEDVIREQYRKLQARFSNE